MKKIKALFVDSFHELKDLKNLVSAAMLLALAVILGFYRIQLTEYIRFGFDSVAKELTGMIFGPVVGCIVGALSDIISFIIKPLGAYFPGFTISAAVAGLIYGMVMYKRPLSLKRVIVANTLVTVLVNLVLNTYWLTLMYGDTFMALFPARIVKQLIMLPIDIILFYAVSKVLLRARVFSGVGSVVNK